MKKPSFLRWWLRLGDFWDRLVAWSQTDWVRRRSPMFPQCHPTVEMLERLLLPTALSGITEYTVPTAASSPLNLALGSDGAVWFTENASGVNKIAKVTTAGSFTEYGLNMGYSAPYDIVGGPDANLWFTETGSLFSNAIGKSTTGGSITDDTISFPGASHITSTRGSDGSLYVASGPNI